MKKEATVAGGRTMRCIAFDVDNRHKWALVEDAVGEERIAHPRAN